eukprot:TRINITY_DN1155_c0_g1_i6.p1 TRINITY_DN1155_c0_g1~~TRINITY_DN1155_c0_g1_i6.p1  ORF type:complete len:156 (-),score=20.73 TRINITY_DN1155_c0_g1_i6:254-721(-)
MGKKNEETMVFCTQCGNQILGQSKFCGNCGRSVASVSGSNVNVGTTPTSHHISDRYLPSSVSNAKTGGDVLRNLGSAMGISPVTSAGTRTVTTLRDPSSSNYPACKKCNGAITGNSITFVDSKFHRHCFYCDGCRVNFADSGNKQVIGKPLHHHY